MQCTREAISCALIANKPRSNWNENVFVAIWESVENVNECLGVDELICVVQWCALGRGNSKIVEERVVCTWMLYVEVMSIKLAL